MVFLLLKLLLLNGYNEAKKLKHETNANYNVLPMLNLLTKLKYLIDSSFKRSKTQEFEIFVQPYIQKIPILDTEYAAIISANPREASFLVQHIDLYRTTISPQLKDILLYRIGAYMQIFSAEDKGIEDIVIEQHNWRLSPKQRQKVIEFLAEQFRIVL